MSLNKGMQLAILRSPSASIIGLIRESQRHFGKLTSVTHPGGRIVVIGCGWGGYSLLKKINSKQQEVVLVSPRNHFLFTPLLPSAAVGTLEFRCIIEPVRNLGSQIKFHMAKCDQIDFDKKQLIISPETEQGTNRKITLSYDKIIIACGAVSNTFNIPGVAEHAFFLKQVGDARKIRQRIVECFEAASEPGIKQEDIEASLNFVVVGAGPTGVEFSGELYDFISSDLVRLYPHLKDYIRVTLVEASPKILSTFDQSLSEFAVKRFIKQGIRIENGAIVKEVQKGKAILKDGREIKFGLMVWSTGLGQNELVEKLDVDKEGSRILTDPYLRVMRNGKAEKDIYAIGDCATILKANNAQTAQVALQKGYYLAQQLNKISAGNGWIDEGSKEASISTTKNQLAPFSYRHLGTLAYLGGSRALVDSSLKISGRAAWLMWRSAYLSMATSTKNKILIPMYWFLTWAFGRDVGRF